MSPSLKSPDVGRNEQRLGERCFYQQKYSEAEGLFRQAADARERTLGGDHRNTLRSKYWLGESLYEQKKYDDARPVVQQVADGRERTYGKDHPRTLSSKHRLGRILYKQEQYSEAEGLFQQVAVLHEKILGEDHQETLNVKYWLGESLYDQQKYSEAGEIFQQVADGEKILGENHRKTLTSKHRLGRILYKQEQYSAAQGIFQQVAVARERTLGGNHKYTLESKYWLGEALIKQKDYSKATEIFQQLTDGREKTLGSDHENTLKSKHRLVEALYKREKYSEAKWLCQQVTNVRNRVLGEDHHQTLMSKYRLARILYQKEDYNGAKSIFQQVAVARERTLGRDHKNTLKSKYWLGILLEDEKKYSEAEEIFRQVADGRERACGKNHEDTLESKRCLGEVLYKQQKYSEAEELLQAAANGYEKTFGKGNDDFLGIMRVLEDLRVQSFPSFPMDDTVQKTLSGRLDKFFLEWEGGRDRYTDTEIDEISRLLKHSNRRWSKVPRTYIVLRNIGHLALLDELIDVGFSDYWFPVTERSLPGCLLPTIRTVFVKAQNLVLTKSIDLEKGEKGQHCYYTRGESPPFEIKEILGRGGFGQVDRVVSLISLKEYATKRVLRALAFRDRRKEDVQLFIAEIEILKRLKHHHIVELVGSYTDTRYMGLVMSPVAEMDLSKYLARATTSNHPQLRTFFGCLATALEYLHMEKIRHKDIKPANILVDRGNVLLADFGLSFDFTDADGSTTMSMVKGRTPRYCAPEVAQDQPRSTMSDIWSLGVVFMEMIVVLKGMTVQDMDAFFESRSQQPFIRTNLDALPDFIADLKGIGSRADNRALKWTRRMLSVKPTSRPTASLVVEATTETNDEGRNPFCGICCVISEESEASSSEFGN